VVIDVPTPAAPPVGRPIRSNPASEPELSPPEPDICSGKGPAIRTILDSYQATVGLVDLAGGLFRTAGLQIPEGPTLSGGTDTTSLSADDAAIKDFIAALTIAADSLGRC
jgi:hypothetical protein